MATRSERTSICNPRRSLRFLPLIAFAALSGACTALAQNAPAGLEPAPGAEVPVNVTLKWPAVPNATTYEVYFGQGGATSALPFQIRVSRPEFRLETLTAGKEYRWQVAPVVDGKAGTPGAPQTFRTRAQATNDEKYAWSIKVANSIRHQYPKPENLRLWNYTEGMTLDALYAIATRTGREDDIAFCKAWLDRFIKPDGSISNEDFPLELYSLDRVRPGPLCLWMYDRTKDERYLKAANLMAKMLTQQPKTSDGGYWHRSTYPNQMWLDGIYMADVFSVEYGLKTNQPHFVDDAIKQITLIHKHTHDPKTGLYYHGWDETKTRPWANKETGASPEFWGRAIGWYAMAIADVLDWLPENHPGRAQILPIEQALCAALVKYQDRDTGMWFQIMDKPTAPKNYVETSCSLMFAYAMARGAQRGWLPPEYLEHARRATRGILNHKVDLLDNGDRFDLQGTVNVGSLGGNGGFYDYYVGVPLTPNDLKGVGTFEYLSMVLSETANDCGEWSRNYPRTKP